MADLKTTYDIIFGENEDKEKALTKNQIIDSQQELISFLTKKAYPKEVKPRHIEIILIVVEKEFPCLNKAGKENTAFQPPSTKTKRWLRDARQYLENNLNQFEIIKSEDLEFCPLYDDVAKSKKGDFLRNMRGKLIQKVFEREGLNKLGIGEIHKILKNKVNK